MENAGLEFGGPKSRAGKCTTIENDGLNTDNDNIFLWTSWKAIPFESTKDSSQSSEHFWRF